MHRPNTVCILASCNVRLDCIEPTTCDWNQICKYFFIKMNITKKNKMGSSSIWPLVMFSRTLFVFSSWHSITSIVRKIWNCHVFVIIYSLLRWINGWLIKQLNLESTQKQNANNQLWKELLSLCLTSNILVRAPIHQIHNLHNVILYLARFYLCDLSREHTTAQATALKHLHFFHHHHSHFLRYSFAM